MNRIRRVLLHVKFLIRYWLGVEHDRKALDDLAEAITANVQHVDEAFRTITEQLNNTTAGAMDTDARLQFYEQHVETLRYAHERLKRALAKRGNGEISSIAGGVRGD